MLLIDCPFLLLSITTFHCIWNRYCISQSKSDFWKLFGIQPDGIADEPYGLLGKTSASAATLLVLFSVLLLAFKG